MIYLDDKDPDDEVDFSVDVSDFFPEGFSIDDTDVEITGAGNSESPIELSVVSFFAQPAAVGVLLDTVVVFWLAGGTEGVRYRGRIRISDDESVSPDRRYSRAFEVMVKTQ